MSEQQDKLSLLLDEFADDEQSRRMLDEVEADVNLQYRLRRYAMIGQVMRHELPKHIESDFSANVMAQINSISHTAKLVADRRSLWTWPKMKPFAGLAIAASVAVVSITLWQTVNVDPGSGPGTEQVVIVDQQIVDQNNADQQKIERLARLPVQTNVVTVGMRWKNNTTPALQQKLNAYLVNHTEYSNSIQGMSLIPQARVAGYDAQQ
ncbi:MAG: sigma-E factor negative regulatory protein [Gammaproteobacteria bacterium]|nr:sigma-E factor negative regulatory protein [Gammaproteobacteria bacterium]